MFILINSKTPELINFTTVVSFKLEDDNRIKVVYKDEKLVSYHAFDSKEAAVKALKSIHNHIKH